MYRFERLGGRAGVSSILVKMGDDIPLGLDGLGGHGLVDRELSVQYVYTQYIVPMQKTR